MSSWITSDWAQELRTLWNEYDPIGVYHFEDSNDWPKDEYDSYHGVIITHLNKGSSHKQIVKSVKHIVTVNLGLTWSSQLKKLTNEFVSKILAWFEAKKPELAQ